jgi:hypothetical protein
MSHTHAHRRRHNVRQIIRAVFHVRMGTGARHNDGKKQDEELEKGKIARVNISITLVYL